MNHSKLEVVKQEMASVTVDILGTSELKWTGRVNLTQMTIISTTVGRESLRRNEVAIMVNKRVRNAVPECNLKNDRVISLFPKANHSILW